MMVVVVVVGRRMHDECKAPARSRLSNEPGESAGAPSPSQVVESRRTKRRRAARRVGGKERTRRAEEGSQPPGIKVERREENDEEESKGSGRGHPPPPPSHSLAHPDYPQPGAGHTVMSIEEVLNFDSTSFSSRIFGGMEKGKATVKLPRGVPQ